MRRFVETPTAQTVLDAVKLAADMRLNALITGPAGVGKTEALTEAARRDARAIFITATPAERTLRAALALVMDAFRLSTWNSDTADMANVLRHRLPQEAAAGRFLIIDEAQILSGDALRQILTYSDNTDEWPLPVVFAGNEYALKRTRANAAAFDQVMSRMTIRRQISGIQPGDIVEFCIDWNVEGRDAYALMHSFGSGRNCRELDKLLMAARKQAGPSGPIKLQSIRDALMALYGPELARKLTTNIKPEPVK